MSTKSQESKSNTEPIISDDKISNLNDLINNLWVITNELKRQSTMRGNQNEYSPELMSENDQKPSNKNQSN